MKNLWRFVATLVVFKLSLTCVHANSSSAETELDFKEAYIRAMPPGSKSTAVYGTFENRSDKTLTIVEVKSSLGYTMLHETLVSSEGMSSMKHVDKVVVEAGKSIQLVPGGMHIMIMGLKANLNLGESHSVAVVTDDGQEHHYQVKVSDK